MTLKQRIVFERYLAHNAEARTHLEQARLCLLEILDGESSDPEARRALLELARHRREGAELMRVLQLVSKGSASPITVQPGADVTTLRFQTRDGESFLLPLSHAAAARLRDAIDRALDADAEESEQ